MGPKKSLSPNHGPVTLVAELPCTWWVQATGLCKHWSQLTIWSSAREMRSSGEFWPSDEVLQCVEGQVVSFPSRHLLGDTNFTSWKWSFSWSWDLSFVFIIHPPNSTGGKKKREPITPSYVQRRVTGKHGRAKSIGVPPVSPTYLLCSNVC